jgi:hypothetical protein
VIAVTKVGERLARIETQIEPLWGQFCHRRGERGTSEDECMNGPIAFTAFDIAQRFIGLAETPGVVHTPQVVAMMELVDRRVRDDETPWCAAFVNYVAWLLNLPRSQLPRRALVAQGGHAIPSSRRGQAMTW